jgi:hypothetical protein
MEGFWADRVITPRRAAIAGMVAPVLWASLLFFLDVVQYDFLVSIGSDPLTKGPASENALGPIGWLYMVNDGLFGLLVITFALGLRQCVNGNWWTWLGIASLIAFGAGFVVGVLLAIASPGSQPLCTARCTTSPRMCCWLRRCR